MKSCPLKTTVILMFYSNTMGVACGAGTTNPSRAPKFIPDLQWGSRVAWSLVFYVMF